MVRRQVPLKTLSVLALVLPVLALLHGLVRVRGDLLSGFAYLVEMFGSNGNLFQTLASTLVERISELEEFSIIRRGGPAAAEGQVERLENFPVDP